MRMLEKNKRKCYYALPTGEKPILDEWGNDTLEVETTYTEKTELNVNYSPSTGREYIDIFGENADYSKVLAFDHCPLTKGAILWIDSEEPNYRVEQIADSINSTLVAVIEI